MANPTVTELVVFNPVSNLMDIITAAVTGPGVPGTPVVLNPNGVIDPTLLQSGVTALAGQNLLPGNLVNLYQVGGVLYAQLAFAAYGGSPPLLAPSGSAYPLAAAGFVSSPTPVSQPVSVSFDGIFYYSDVNSEFSVGSIGGEAFLSPTVAGGATPTRPSGVGQLVQSVGYVLTYDALTVPATVGIGFIAGFNDFARLSGVAQVNQGGTGATTGAQALINLIGGSPSVGQVLVWNGVAWVSGPTIGDIDSDHYGLTASLGPITLLTSPASPPTSSTYRISIYEECTTAGGGVPFGRGDVFGVGNFDVNGIGGQPFGFGVFGSGPYVISGDSLQTSLSWTDDVGPRVATPLPTPLDLTDTNSTSGDIFIRVAAGTPITFTAALAAVGMPTYNIFVRLETL